MSHQWLKINYLGARNQIVESLEKYKSSLIRILICFSLLSYVKEDSSDAWSIFAGPYVNNNYWSQVYYLSKMLAFFCSSGIIF